MFVADFALRHFYGLSHKSIRNPHKFENGHAILI